MRRKCSDCRNPLEACTCEEWYRAFQIGFYEALDARMNMRPLTVHLPQGIEPPEDLRIDLEVRRLNHTVVCEHGAPLKRVTDATVACWECGRIFDTVDL